MARGYPYATDVLARSRQRVKRTCLRVITMWLTVCHHIFVSRSRSRAHTSNALRTACILLYCMRIELTIFAGSTTTSGCELNTCRCYTASFHSGGPGLSTSSLKPGIRTNSSPAAFLSYSPADMVRTWPSAWMTMPNGSCKHGARTEHGQKYNKSPSLLQLISRE